MFLSQEIDIKLGQIYAKIYINKISYKNSKFLRLLWDIVVFRLVAYLMNKIQLNPSILIQFFLSIPPFIFPLQSLKSDIMGMKVYSGTNIMLENLRSKLTKHTSNETFIIYNKVSL